MRQSKAEENIEFQEYMNGTYGEINKIAYTGPMSREQFCGLMFGHFGAFMRENGATIIHRAAHGDKENIALLRLFAGMIRIERQAVDDFLTRIKTMDQQQREDELAEMRRRKALGLVS